MKDKNYKLKCNTNKGFTLIELLVTILLIGIVVSLSVVGVTAYVGKSREKSRALSITNLKDSAKVYAKEHYNSNDWITSINSGKEVTCVSRDQIIAKGLIEEKNTNNLDIDYILLERDVEKKLVSIKGTLSNDKYNEYEKQTKSLIDSSNIDLDYDDDEYNYQVCKKIVIDRPKVEQVDTYTSAIEATFKISPELDEDRKITNLKCELTDNAGLTKSIEVGELKNEANTENQASISNSNGNNVTCIFTNLKYENDKKEENKYNVTLSVTYNNNSEEKGVNNSKENITLKQLKSPTILIDGNKKESTNYVRQREITINYNTDGMHSSSKVGESYKLGSSDYVDIDIVSDTVNFSVDNNQEIFAKISDGTNEKIVSKKIQYIDNIDYQCDIRATYNSSNTSAELTAYVSDEKGSNINSDYILGYMWDGEKYKKYSSSSKITSNEISIAKKTVYVSGNYSISIENRRQEKISCSVNPDKLPSAANISINIYKSDDLNTVIDGSNWYNQNLTAKIETTTPNAKVSYCIVNSENETCEPIAQDTDLVTVNLTEDGIKKIIAYATLGEIKSNSIINYMKVDKTAPNVPSSTVNGTKYNSEYNSTNSWSNTKAVWTNFLATDNNSINSGISHYEYYSNGITKDTTSCSDIASSVGGTRLYGTYTYENVDWHFCIRSVDNAGNVSPWSGVYHFRVDTTVPNIPSSTVNGTKYNSAYNSTNSWSNAKLVWTNFSATDPDSSTSSANGVYSSTINSGINHYEFLSVGSTATSCSGSTGSTLEDSYTYTNRDLHFCIRSVDNAGNVSPWSGVYHFRVDTTSPTVNVSFNNSYTNNTWSNLANVKASATCSDTNTCKLKYKTSGATTTSSTSGSSKKISNEGSTKIIFTATDVAGNTTTVTKYIKLDRTDPTVNVSFNNSYTNNTWKNLANVTATATCSDANTCNLKYETSGATTTSSTSGSSKKISNEGSTKIKFSATDSAGNKTTVTKYVKLDRTPPSFKFSKTSFVNSYINGEKAQFAYCLVVNKSDLSLGTSSQHLSSFSWPDGSNRCQSTSHTYFDTEIGTGYTMKYKYKYSNGSWTEELDAGTDPKYLAFYTNAAVKVKIKVTDVAGNVCYRYFSLNANHNVATKSSGCNDSSKPSW